MKPSYDVFLSHSSADKPTVKELARKLRDAGIEPFLDEWHLTPGKPWQPELEAGLRNSRACIVFVGAEGIGPWHGQEMQIALNRGANDPDFPVIPVLLPGFKKPADVPDFLALRTWVEFTVLEDAAAFHRLVSGIQGKAPGPSGKGEPAKNFRSYRCMAQPPDEWVHRREYDEILEALCPKDGIQPPQSVGITTALRGGGGFGKTALAQKLCFDERVRESYPDGILWMTMGEDLSESGRLSRIRDLIRWWTEKEAPAFETVAAAGAEIRKLLAGSRVLVVIDDAWSPSDIDPLKGLGNGAALLITTRIAPSLPESSLSIPVDAMASSEAVSLLTLGLGKGGPSSREFESLATRLGEWALLLKLVNGTLRKFVKGGLSIPESLQRVNENLEEEGFSAFDQNDPESRHAAVSRAILVSARLLSEKDCVCYFQLAIFPEDENIPLSVLERYWGMNRSATRRLCNQLNDLSLLRDFDQRRESIRLHDVTRRVLVEQRKQDIATLHLHFLDLNRPASGKWQDLSGAEIYNWKRLGYHLVEAERRGEFQELLSTFSFLEAKLKATDINELIADYEPFAGEDQELRLIRDALRLSAHVLAKDRAQLASQFFGRLRSRNEKRLRIMVEKERSQRRDIGLWPRVGSLTQPGGPLIRILEGRRAGVNAMAVVDGGRVVLASSDRMLRVWDLESGQVLQILEGHTDRVTAVAIVDGGRLVSASLDWTLRVWDLESGRTLQILEGHTDGVKAVAVVDGRHIVSASKDRTLRVWDLESGQTLQTLKGHKHGVNAIAVKGRRAVSASNDRTLRVWDLESGQTLQTLQKHTDRVNAVAIVENYNAVSASNDGTLQVWDLESGQALRTLEGHMNWLTAVAVVDSRRIISASNDRTLRMWDLESGQTLQTFEGHTDRVTAVAVIDGRRAVSASHDGMLRVWDLENGYVLQTLKGHTDRVNSVSVVDRRRAISASYDGTLRVWDLENGKVLQTLVGHRNRVNAVAVIDGRRAVSVSNDRMLRVWDLENGQSLQTIEGHTNKVTAIAVVGGQRAVSASDDRTLRVWDLDSGEVLAVITLDAPVGAIAVSLDGKVVVAGDQVGRVHFLDLVVPD